mmetsp:Transcript_106547/g.329131  ORF Transcript_106547/g.329131 Transcript_106547/m.329131 type:complete len:239 (+) Transcript_106547:44-760(+)
MSSPCARIATRGTAPLRGAPATGSGGSARRGDVRAERAPELRERPALRRSPDAAGLHRQGAVRLPGARVPAVARVGAQAALVPEEGDAPASGQQPLQEVAVLPEVHVPEPVRAPCLGEVREREPVAERELAAKPLVLASPARRLSLHVAHAKRARVQTERAPRRKRGRLRSESVHTQRRFSIRRHTSLHDVRRILAFAALECSKGARHIPRPIEVIVIKLHYNITQCKPARHVALRPN